MDASPSIAANLKAQGIDVVQGFAPSLPPPKGELNAVFALHVLEHLASVELVQQFLNTAHQRLVNGGRVVIAVPDFARWGQHFYSADYTHCLPFTSRKLRQTIESCGFRVVEDLVQTGPFFTRWAAPFGALLKMLYCPAMQDLGRMCVPRDLVARLVYTFLPNVVMVGEKQST
jgi:hypothetical protein